jgi:inhibitor of cysteine peptidase
MRKFFIFGLLLVLLPTTMYCAEVTLTERDAGKEFKLGKRDLLIINLISNPTTGYSWSYVLSKGSLLSLLSESYQASQKKDGVVGAGGMSTWKFKAKDEGSLMMTFRYARPWERGVAPIRKIRWQIIVKP